MTQLSRLDLIHVVGRREAENQLYIVQKTDRDDWTPGLTRILAHPLIPRLFEGRAQVPPKLHNLLDHDVERLPNPFEALAQALPLRGEAWPTRTKRTLERLFVLWLLYGDRKHLLDAAPIDQLAHQVSLLEYIKEHDFRRLLIADEVGLGKTIEAGLVIQWILQNHPSARVLYLTPAMLVDNVYGELKRMEIQARLDRYSATGGSICNEELSQAQVIIASIHRATFGKNYPVLDAELRSLGSDCRRRMPPCFGLGLSTATVLSSKCA